MLSKLWVLFTGKVGEAFIYGAGNCVVLPLVFHEFDSKPDQMKDEALGTFITQDQALMMKDVLPMFSYVGLSDNEISVYLGMRAESPYAVKYLANQEQVLNHLQLYACRSMDQVISLGLSSMSREDFSAWIQAPNKEVDNQPPKDLLLDLTKHAALIEVLK